jgi:anhydro-N-acetylmuramic acid kinase
VARATLHANPRPRRGEELAVGLMSGTSCDGIDAALVAIAPRPGGLARVRTIATAFEAYPADVRAHLLRFPRVDLFDLAIVDRELGLRFAAATQALLAAAGVPAKRVSFVASHGHTAIHVPRAHGGATVQIGQPAEIADRLGLRVVADFRPRDVAAGGEGAPLVPFADRILLAKPGRVVACQNIGGIANVTVVGPSRDDVLAFDTGPGNMPIDAAVAHATNGRRRFDEGGRIAASGTVDLELLRTLRAIHPYFRRRPPKSTGREEFGAPFTDALLARAKTAKARRDLVATLTALTAQSIADAYARFLPRVDECVVSGGGVHNATLLRHLRDALGGTPVVSSAARGVDPDFKEAIAFALLGWAHLRGLANTVPAATGAAHAVVAGAVWPGAGGPTRGR